jgi:hypothetical protein
VVTVTATGRAVPKAVAVAEIAKRSHGGALHQVTTIDSLDAADGARRRKSDAEGASDENTRIGEPMTNENVTKTKSTFPSEPNVGTRRVTAIAIALSRDARALNPEAPGYQFSPETTPTESLTESLTARSDRRKDDRAFEPEKKNTEAAAATPDGKADAPRRRRTRRGRGGAKKEKAAEKEKAAHDADA